MHLSAEEIISKSPMRWPQIVAILICVLLNALDGFDIMAVSFVAPGITEYWGIDQATLGAVLSMELFGMAAGSIILGRMADKYGRRPIILSCLVSMTIGMYLASTATSIGLLSVYRFFTGLGIGGMITATIAQTAELSNTRWRNFVVILMASGYPLGAVIGGSVSSVLLVHSDWRSIFLLGSIVSFVFIPLVWFFIPESISYLSKKQPPDALMRINKILSTFKQANVKILPVEIESHSKIGFSQLLSNNLRSTTMLLCIAYFAHILTFYFVLKWVPKLVVDMGFSVSLAAQVLVWANIGGVIGSLVLGLLTLRITARRLTIIVLILSSVMVAFFGQGQDSYRQISIVVGITGFMIFSGAVGLQAVMVQSFPATVRASGVGFVIGVGRGASAVSPIIAGLLFVSGLGLAKVAAILAIGSLVAGISLILLGNKSCTSRAL